MAGPFSGLGSMGTAGTSLLELLLFVFSWCWESFAGVIQGKISFSKQVFKDPEYCHGLTTSPALSTLGLAS